MLQTPENSANISPLSLFAVSWYLREELMILRLMLYREECIHPGTRPCLHNENLLCKIGELEKELADYKDQLAA